MSKQFKEKRQIEILSLVEQKPYGISIADLCQLYDVQTATINRDLQELRAEGLAIYSRNGGLFLEEPLTSANYNYLLSRYLGFSGEAIGYPKNIALTTKKLKNKSLHVFTSIITAIEKKKTIRIEYIKYYTSEVITRVLDPYHLFPSSLNWRLIAWSEDRFKQFIVQNIKSVEVIERSFKRRKGFRIEDQFRDSFEFWESDDKYSVSLLFSKDVSHQILNGIWSEEQVVSELDGGKIRLELKVNNLEQLGDWVITWGNDVIIESPKELKQYVVTLAKGILHSNPE